MDFVSWNVSAVHFLFLPSCGNYWRLISPPATDRIHIEISSKELYIQSEKLHSLTWYSQIPWCVAQLLCWLKSYHTPKSSSYQSLPKASKHHAWNKATMYLLFNNFQDNFWAPYPPLPLYIIAWRGTLSSTCVKYLWVKTYKCWP